MAFLMVALLGMAALAIDLGILFSARTESQAVADAAALAGAGALISAPGDAAAIREEAKNFAAMNLVGGMPAVVLDEDVEIDFDAERVRVSVRNIADRGNAIPTNFARILGIAAVDVATVAAAEVSGASKADCLLPVALPDEWADDGDGMWNPPNDTYMPWPDPDYTGYGDDDIGLQIEIKTFETEDPNAPAYCQSSEAYDACNAFADDSWKCWWREAPPNQGGGGGDEALDPRIRSCSMEEFAVRDTIWAASGSGNKQTLVKEPFVAVVDSDPTAYWDETNKCVARPGEGCVTESSRMRRLPLIDPHTVVPDPIDGANTHAEIANFAGVFVEKVSCSSNVAHKVGPAGRWNVYVRFLGFTGQVPIEREDSLLKTIRLVE